MRKQSGLRREGDPHATWIVLGMGILSGLFLLVACNQMGTVARSLAPQAATITAAPTLTPTSMPTPTPVPEPVPFAGADWDTVTQFYPAMRPEFSGDIDANQDRNRYLIAAALTFEKHSAVITGQQRVRYTNTTPDTLREIAFRLYPNFPAMGGSMTIERVWVNDVPVTPQLIERDTTLLVPLATALAPTASVEIALTFTARAERNIYATYGAFGYQDDIFAGPEWFPALSVYRPGSGWWTAHPGLTADLIHAETALFEYWFTTPAEVHAVMTGTTLATAINSNGTRTHHVVTGPVRDMVIVASARYETLERTENGITVCITYQPGSATTAARLLTIAHAALQVYGETIAPYPFARFDVIEGYNFVGVEYPTLIVLAEPNWRAPEKLELMLAHEIAHQWFFSLVGTDQILEPWLDEALASYLEYTYTEAIHGAEAAQALQNQDRAVYDAYRMTAANPRLNQPAEVFADDNYGALMYAKGPIFMLHLQQTVGQPLFWDALRVFYSRYRYHIATSADFYRTFTEISHADLNALFAEWIGDFAAAP